MLKIKSTVALVAGLAAGVMVFAAVAAPAPAQADATQDKINALLAEISALKASMGGSSSMSYTFTRDLTIGASGPDVTALQQFLMGKGHVIAAGATGYFGAQTQAALAAYQAANGIAPAAGYFGPVTRAKVAGSAGTVTPGTPTTPGSLEGGEGSLDINDNLGDVESEVDEGDDSINVLGVELEAKDSDIALERVDVEITLSGTGSNQIDNYISEIQVMLDGKEIAALDVDEADEDSNNVFSFRFTGIDNAVIDEDETAELYFAVSAVGNVDSGDIAKILSIDVPANGIRAIDGAGISETYVTDSNVTAETFNVVEATAGSLDLSKGGDNPDAGVIGVDADSSTNDVTIMSFDLEADDQDVEVTDIPVGLVVSENEGVDGPVKSVKLVQDGKTLDTVSVPASAGTSYQALFENINVSIEDGDTATFDVVVDLNDTDLTTFASGTTIYATTTGSNTAWDVEDAEGDAVTPDGSVTGETMTFYEDSISAEIVETSVVNVFSADSAGEFDKKEFIIKFDVTAIGDDMYLDRSLTADADRNGSGAAGSGFQWSTSTDSTTGTTTSVTISSNNDTDDTTTLYKIDAGDTRTFTLSALVTAGITGSTAVQLNGINWTTVAGDASAASFYTSNLNDFKTDLKSMIII